MIVVLIFKSETSYVLILLMQFVLNLSNLRHKFDRFGAIVIYFVVYIVSILYAYIKNVPNSTTIL